MSAAFIKNQITTRENRIRGWRSDISNSRDKIAEMERAREELAKTKGRFEYEMLAVSSYTGKIVAKDSLGLEGVQKLRNDVNISYKGTRERNFTRSIEDTLNQIRRKITEEEGKITRWTSNISVAQGEVVRLERDLQKH